MVLSKTQPKSDMFTKKLFVIEQSMAVRSILRKLVSHSTDIEIVGSAGNFENARNAIAQTLPDVVLLELQAETAGVIDQIGIIKSIASQSKIIFSVPRKRLINELKKTAGINKDDCWRKDFNEEHPVEHECQAAIAELLKRIRSSQFSSAVASPANVLTPEALSQSARTTRQGQLLNGELPRNIGPRALDPASSFGGGRLWRPELIAIGSSTGGPDALAHIVSKIDKSFDLPIVIAQHMPANFTEQLATRLSSHGQIPALQAEHGMLIECGKIYIAPGDYHLEVVRDKLDLRAALHQGPKVNSCRPAVDVLFHSVASSISKGALGVVLTGMGRDGEAGANSIRRTGGQVWVQDEASSVIWGMPGAVAKANLANRVISLNRFGEEFNALMRSQQRPRNVCIES